MEKSILSINDAAHFTGFSKSHLYKLTHYRKIEHYKPNGKKIFFKREDLEAYLLSGKREVQSTEDLESEAANYSLKNSKL